MKWTFTIPPEHRLEAIRIVRDRLRIGVREARDLVTSGTCDLQISEVAFLQVALAPFIKAGLTPEVRRSQFRLIQGGLATP